MTLSKSIDSIPHRWSTRTNALVYSHGNLLTNRYNFTIGFLHTKEDPTINEMMLDKMEIFFNGILSNSIIINKESYSENKPNVDNNIFMVMDTVNDQAIGSFIYLKLFNLMKEDLSIEYITISSELGKDIEYTIDEESIEIQVYVPAKKEWWGNDDVKFDPWWDRGDTATYDVLINDNEIFTGEFKWEDIFKEEIEKIKIEDDKKSKFKIINGGKDVN